MKSPGELLAAPCRFDLSHYEYILSRALRLRYRFITHIDYARNGPPGPLFILLRHDIDVSLAASLPLIKLEQELGICSTIFLRTHAEGYNMFDLGNYALLCQYRTWGCEIGLHYDPFFIEVTREDPITLLEREKAVMEAILGDRVYGLVSHAPRLALTSGKIEEENIASVGFEYDANDSRFTSANLYVSDANRFWKRGCLCKHLGVVSRMTVLVHPCWWQPMSPSAQYDIINRLRQGL